MRPPHAAPPRRPPSTDRTPYPASGLLWLQGLTAAASGDHAAALDHFVAEETTSRGASTVYARECLVLALEAQGFTHLALGDRDAAGPAFQAAAAASPGHGRATLGLAIAAGEATEGVERVTSACADMARVGKHGECALLLAAAHAWGGRADEGLAVAEQALVTTSPDATGWSLPADPLFAPLRAAGGLRTAGGASRLAGVLSRHDSGHRFSRSPGRTPLEPARRVEGIGGTHDPSPFRRRRIRRAAAVLDAGRSTDRAPGIDARFHRIRAPSPRPR